MGFATINSIHDASKKKVELIIQDLFSSYGDPGVTVSAEIIVLVMSSITTEKPRFD